MDTGSSFDYDAPQFLDFTTAIDDDGADRFFDTDHEAERVNRLNTHSQSVKSCRSSPNADIQEATSTTTTSESLWQTPINGGNGAKRTKTGTGLAKSNEEEPNSIQSGQSAAIQEIIRSAATPSTSSRLIKPTYAPTIQVTQAENGDAVNAVVMTEVAHQGVSVQLHKRATKVEPFSFEERNNRIRKQKVEKIQKILEEEKRKREFRANPLPDFSHASFLHQNTTVCVTNPMDICFRTEKRIQERHKRDVSCEKEDRYQFKAKPATVLQKPPFEPKKAELPLTDITGFRLNTENRAKKREEFNLRLKEKEANENMMRAQRHKEEKIQETEEIRRLRSTAVHKAAPVPRELLDHPFQPQPSELPLTEPVTPLCLKRGRE